MEDQELTPKAAKKQRDILTTALQVFAKEGFRNTDVQVIADLAGVGKGTVYRHFGNKEQLFLATAKYCVNRLGEYVEKQVGDELTVSAIIEKNGTPELLRRIARSCAEFYQKHPHAIEIMIQERAEFRESVYPTHLMFRAETRAGFDELIRLAMERGEIRQGNVKEVSDTFGDLLFGSLINGCLEGGKTKLVERVEKAVDLLLNGLVISEMSGDSNIQEKSK
ncbi:TetR/AcrR family transcriptional regulator [Rubinisphaera brasiliensis]|uniref:Transcriptional regulator, TetR family n=1 Tax=Rubinisphaera brasiliensis (strain ATCC 49424 / DSM 5305 / JCM 21570 / IAM 15109 / NBRC 103401 / IFAM 1448) TaxID=756272 RepID=F0SJ24_RUBBR|nr:TetR/AcrR family transcriptional regulator [Rubinisphaera brasiliensis]ADY58566.1 transcriptional regulator, TetR family [Rubinisphaera brasiliensis DSM 5305]